MPDCFVGIILGMLFAMFRSLVAVRLIADGVAGKAVVLSHRHLIRLRVLLVHLQALQDEGALLGG